MFVVAGVTGHVGSVVAKTLLEHKQVTRVIVRDAAKGAEWSKLGAEVAVGALEDARFLEGALKGAKGFFTLLPPGYTEPEFYAHQRKVADAIGQAVTASRVPRVVMLSSVGADLDSGNGPIKGLHYLENVLRRTGTTLTAIRAGSFQENVANSLAPAKEMGIYPNFVPSADYPMPMIATKDIGKLAAAELLEHRTKNEIVDLHGPAYSSRQVAEKLGAALGKTLAIIDIPAAGHVEAMMKGGMPQYLAEIFAEMYAGFASGRLVPKGDRMVHGTVTLDDTLHAMLGAAGPRWNQVHWFEIPVKNLDRAKSFYEQVLGLTISNHEMGPMKMGWFPMSSGGTGTGATGALVQGEGYTPSHAGSVVYFTVPSIEQTLGRIVERGGKVLAPKMSIGDHGFIAQFEDCEGNRVALHAVK